MNQNDGERTELRKRLDALVALRQEEAAPDLTVPLRAVSEQLTALTLLVANQQEGIAALVERVDAVQKELGDRVDVARVKIVADVEEAIYTLASTMVAPNGAATAFREAGAASSLPAEPTLEEEPEEEEHEEAAVLEDTVVVDESPETAAEYAPNRHFQIPTLPAVMLQPVDGVEAPPLPVRNPDADRTPNSFWRT